jgi:CheY-like chemotaxis protein
MTPDMRFDCLLVSRDSDVLSVMNRILEDLSIHTHICVTTSRATELLAKHSIDLAVLDWSDDASKQLLLTIWSRPRRAKTTIIAVSAQDRPVAGAHLVLRKPFTIESSTKLLWLAYSRMVQDYRRSARYATMISTIATGVSHRALPVTVLDIGQEGLGLRTAQKLAVGEVLTLDLALPDAKRSIHVEARVLWTREHGVAGCEFLRIPPVDLDILRGWLFDRCQIKKPATELRGSSERVELESL